jgi:hypothetical protein
MDIYLYIHYHYLHDVCRFTLRKFIHIISINMIYVGELIGDKPWDMKGEVNAVGRPENSLLEISAQIER